MPTDNPRSILSPVDFSEQSRHALRWAAAFATRFGSRLTLEGGSWLAFAVLFFAPDVSFAGYIAGPRIGAALYNVAHSYVGPLLLAATLLSAGTGLTLALVWGAHIGFDRALGYGLKYSSACGDTHLGRIGRLASAHLDPPVIE